jgi:hypothetical protein
VPQRSGHRPAFLGFGGFRTRHALLRDHVLLRSVLQRFGLRRRRTSRRVVARTLCVSLSLDIRGSEPLPDPQQLRGRLGLWSGRLLFSELGVEHRGTCLWLFLPYPERPLHRRYRLQPRRKHHQFVSVQRVERSLVLLHVSSKGIGRGSWRAAVSVGPAGSQGHGATLPPGFVLQGRPRLREGEKNGHDLVSTGAKASKDVRRRDELGRVPGREPVLQLRPLLPGQVPVLVLDVASSSSVPSGRSVGSSTTSLPFFTRARTVNMPGSLALTGAATAVPGVLSGGRNRRVGRSALQGRGDRREVHRSGVLPGAPKPARGLVGPSASVHSALGCRTP